MKQFGETVNGYSIPVLNEREIRASAGILFLFLFVSFMFAVLEMNFLLLKYFIIIFCLDFVIRVIVNPEYSPTLIIGRFIVSKQVPEYVGAAPKKFAWIIGLALSTIMFAHMIIVNSYSPITGIICLICLIFLFFESAFGICLGCLFYPLFYKDKTQYCTGDICVVKSKHDIQRISKAQILIIICFALFVFIITCLFNDILGINPDDLFVVLNSIQYE